MLKPDREYTVIVIAITNEGRFRSRPAKARTLKDGGLYPLAGDNHSDSVDLVRHSLYEQPTQSTPKIKRTDTFCARKISPVIERQFTRESKLIAQCSTFSVSNVL